MIKDFSFNFSFRSILNILIVCCLFLSTTSNVFSLDNNKSSNTDSSSCIDKFNGIEDESISTTSFDTKNNYHKLFSKIKGHLFLLTTVGAGFFFTSQITNSIPEEYSYISSIVTFASGMAVVAIGAPIFRKIFPIIDQQAFKISSYRFDPIDQDSQNLREVWESMNKYFDVNSQMGVNQLIKVQELISSTITRILLEPIESRQQYAREQFIWLASLYYKYFYYISLNDKTTISTITTMFYNHKEINFSKLVEEVLDELENRSSSDKEKKYYKYLLHSWFKNLI